MEKNSVRGTLSVTVLEVTAMKPMNPSEPKGLWVSVLLPISSDERVDYSRLQQEMDILVASGGDGFYTNGTAAEFYNQTEEEFDRISSTVAEWCERAGVPFQEWYKSSQPYYLDYLARWVKTAESLKPSAMQVILPDWVSPTPDEMVSFPKRLTGSGKPKQCAPHSSGCCSILTPEIVVEKLRPIVRCCCPSSL